MQGQLGLKIILYWAPLHSKYCFKCDICKWHFFWQKWYSLCEYRVLIVCFVLFISFFVCFILFCFGWWATFPKSTWIGTTSNFTKYLWRKDYIDVGFCKIKITPLRPWVFFFCFFLCGWGLTFPKLIWFEAMFLILQKPMST